MNLDVIDELNSLSACTQKTFMHRLDYTDGHRIVSAAIDEIRRIRADLALALLERDAADEVARTARLYVGAMEAKLADSTINDPSACFRQPHPRLP